MTMGDLPGIYNPIKVPAPSGGMFGSTPNWVNAVQAAVGGYLQGRGMPGGQSLLNQVHQRQMMAQQQAMAEQQYQRERQDGMTDWIAKQEYSAAHPQPVNNDTINDFNFISQQLGEKAAKEWLRNMGDPIVTTQLPGNRVYSGPRSQLGTALGAPVPGVQPGHVEDGFRFRGGNPADPSAWEPVNGGPTARPSGMFP